MKTPNQCTSEEGQTARRSTEQRHWKVLEEYCRYKRVRVPPTAKLVLGAALIVLFECVSLPHGHLGSLIVALMLGYICLPLDLYYLRRRERALIAVIEAHCPELHGKLKASDLI